MPDAGSQLVVLENAGRPISVSLEFEDRKRLSITVHPNGLVTARAPEGRSSEEVVAHLQRRHLWITRQIRHFQRNCPLPVEKQHVTGETHLYLGRQYRLRVHHNDEASVRLVGRFFEVQVSCPPQTQAVATVLRRWYQMHAEAVFQARIRRCLQSAAALQPQKNLRLRVKPMERRWGSCSRAGTITLNTDLVKMPLHCIDYVIMHEICHLRIHDHSPEYFRLLGRCMPDWRIRKERLDSMVLR